MFIKITSLFFRFSSLGLKFILIFYIGKYFSTENFNDYMMFSSLVAISLLFIGFDFYNFANRELIVEDDKSKVLYNQFLFNLVCYLVLLILTTVLFFVNYYNFLLAFFFFVITLLEHFSQEFFRIFLALKKPHIANFIFFIRNGSWVIFLLFFWQYNIFEKSYNIILINWLIGVFLSVLIGFYFLLKTSFFSFTKLKIDKTWIKKGLGFSLIFFLSTIFNKLIELSDRFILEKYGIKEELAAYLFYSQISMLLSVGLFTVVFSNFFPQLIDFFNKGEIIQFKKAIRKMTIEVFVIILVFLIAIFLLVDYIFEFMNVIHFFKYKTVLYLSLFSTILMNLSLIFHFVLFSKNHVKQILIANLLSFIFNIFLNILLIPKFGLYGAVTSSLVANFILLVTKWKLAQD